MTPLDLIRKNGLAEGAVTVGVGTLLAGIGYALPSALLAGAASGIIATLFRYLFLRVIRLKNRIIALSATLARQEAVIGELGKQSDTQGRIAQDQGLLLEALRKQSDAQDRAIEGQGLLSEALRKQSGAQDLSIRDQALLIETSIERLAAAETLMSKADGTLHRIGNDVVAMARDGRIVQDAFRFHLDGSFLPPASAAIHPFDPEISIPSVLKGLIKPRGLDIGANRGEFSASLLAAGYTVDALEPAPATALYLRARFHGVPNIRIHEVAASDVDGTALLHMAVSSDGGTDPSLFATLNRHPSFDTLRFVDARSVMRCRLDTVLASKAPVSVGILKSDTEGHDLAVLRGATRIEADVLLVEYWSRDFVFNRGETSNGLSDYLGVIDRKKYPFAILFWRDAERQDAYGVQFDPVTEPQNSWGNLLFCRNDETRSAVEGWARTTYGDDRVATKEVVT